jgi:hypothetical protein
MIVIGVDVHKHSLAAVAVDELGRTLAATRSRSHGLSCRSRYWTVRVPARRRCGS